MFTALRRDISAAMERDPAARSRLQVVLLYPGFHAIFLHRLAHGLHRRGFFWLPHVIAWFSRFVTGIEIHPGARIGPGFFADHGMSVVVGETSIVGEDVTVFHGVTLGGTGREATKRHPTVGDGVLIGAGAKILGPIEIGSGAKIGAGAVVLHDVPEGCTAVGVPARVVRRPRDRAGSKSKMVRRIRRIDDDT